MARFHSHSSSRGICGGQSDIGTVFFSTNFSFLPSITDPPMLHKPICHPADGRWVHQRHSITLSRIQLTCLVKGSMLEQKNGYPDCAILVVFLSSSRTQVRTVPHNCQQSFPFTSLPLLHHSHYFMDDTQHVQLTKRR